MKPMQKNDDRRISRGKFFRFLGGIGLLSLIPGLPASAAERKFESPKLTGLRRTDSAKILRSPTIKGQLLSNDALTARLSTKNLENIRDITTGRFFGQAAEKAFRSGYVPLINWNLGAEGNESGCMVQANINASYPDQCPSNCTAYLFSNKEIGEVMITLNLGSQAGSECPIIGCPIECHNFHILDFHDFISYPADKFVREITKILGSKDIGVIRNELKAVIFSDEVLNMGLQHFVLAAHDVMIDDIEEGITTH